MYQSFFKALAVAMLVILPNLSRADDTDIYTSPATQATSEPLVMFSIDIRSSVGQTFSCTGTCLTYFATNNATKSEFAVSAGGTGPGTLTTVANLFEYLRLSLEVALFNFEGKG